mmetsp:Transcript_88906/g.250389  ORF Transcript_88906/g.250389 Transcript_88906/m.250389 type:complete len:482 (+) Transcript_88906:230-1675(+)
MTSLLTVYRVFIPGPNDLSMLVDAAVRGMLLEVDYHNEARNSEEFARRHEFLGFVTSPQWFPEYTGPKRVARVLTTRWIFGRRISDLPWRLGRQAVQMAVQACVVQLLLTGFVHADPHEGNLLYTDDGKLAFLDFGLMDTVEPKIMEGFADGIQGVVGGNWRRVTEAMTTVGFITNPVQKIQDTTARTPVYVDCDFEEFVAAVEKQMTEEEGGDSRFSAMASGLEKLSWRYLMLTPSYIVLLTRTFMTLEGLAEKVDPSFNIYTAAFPVAMRRAISPRTRQARKALWQAVLEEGGQIRWSQLEKLLASFDDPDRNVGSICQAWKDMRSLETLTSTSAAEGGFDVMDGLLGSSDGAVLRRIAYDLDFKSCIKYLASRGARPWRRRAAAWMSKQFVLPRATNAEEGLIVEPAGMATERQRQREKQIVRFMLRKHWRTLLRNGGILGLIMSACLLGGVLSRVLLRGSILALLAAAMSLRRTPKR